MKLITRNEEETREAGKKIAAQLRGGDVVCLYGELGAGKTTFVKGLAGGLGVRDEILSPTFTLMNVYKLESRIWNRESGIETLVHIDTYRLKDEEELRQIGAEDYIGKSNVLTVVEWPEKIEGILEGKRVIKIELKHLDDGGREIKLRMSNS